MPDLETLGGALFGALLQLLVDKLDSPPLLHYFRGRKLDELLKNLRSKLVSINTVIDDAEQNQFRSPYVKAWHDEVRDVLLDTEDLLDEIDYEFSKTELKAEYQSSASKTMTLQNCPILQCLPEEGLPKSISQLRIEDCPLLKERCKKQGGEDWEKIAHIKTIWFDRERLRKDCSH